MGLSDNKITTQGAVLVANLVKKCPTLNELYLANNEIDNDGAKILVDVLKERKNF